MKTWLVGAAALAALLVAAPAAMGQRVDFGSVDVYDELTLYAEITSDTSTTPLAAGEPTISGSDVAAFVITDDGCGGQVHADGVCYVGVTFRPTRDAPHNASLDITVNSESFSVPLFGIGDPITLMTPSRLDFGTVPVGAPPPPSDVTVQNTSDGPLGPLGITVSSFLPVFEVSADSCSGVTLAPGGTCQMAVRYTAARGGTASGELIITSAPDSRRVGDLALRGATPVNRRRNPLPPRIFPPPAPTADYSAGLDERLGAALARLRRAGGRRALLRQGLVVRGVVPPTRGMLGLVVRARGQRAKAGRLVAVRRRQPVQAGRKVLIRARLTRAGRRLLRSGRPLRLKMTLTLVAEPDKRVSSADGSLRLARAPAHRAP